MKLQYLLQNNINWKFSAINEDQELAKQIQTRLIDLGILEGSADGSFGPISILALKKFQQLTKTNEPDYIGSVTARHLIQVKPEYLPQPVLKLGNDLASRIVKYMLAKQYKLFTDSQYYNIVYVEGINPNGTLNNDNPNYFNDIRSVITFENGVPKLAGIWEATTEPGAKYTYRPMNPNGVARIHFGQYKAWSVGMHGTSNPHEALVQVAPVTVYRDLNKDFIRIGDRIETGLFGINQHWGYDFPKNDIVGASAGCLVGRSTKGHREFMALVKRDQRFLTTKQYVFISTIIPGDDLVKNFPVA
ncbi:peptidoglycan-binding protein [Phormidium sp. LEGE 05292]|uniref:peptidoglycan-binding domain-containing protein n=1 Tax=[Phormidium] sp. LEGE 05292 TaxID=767427 RepID=UPI001880702B|nr:peptidoglycan-binding protein [Phormidium sp. LEGE 05292]MBE9228741.1 peptidoglycan-binding protein [Phormidium sp. LEGE 05292]